MRCWLALLHGAAILVVVVTGTDIAAASAATVLRLPPVLSPGLLPYLCCCVASQSSRLLGCPSFHVCVFMLLLCRPCRLRLRLEDSAAQGQLGAKSLLCSRTATVAWRCEYGLTGASEFLVGRVAAVVGITLFLVSTQRPDFSDPGSQQLTAYLMTSLQPPRMEKYMRARPQGLETTIV